MGLKFPVALTGLGTICSKRKDNGGVCYNNLKIRSAFRLLLNRSSSTSTRFSTACPFAGEPMHARMLFRMASALS